jgi:hypothetical protein
MQWRVMLDGTYRPDTVADTIEDSRLLRREVQETRNYRDIRSLLAEAQRLRHIARRLRQLSQLRVRPPKVASRRNRG